MTGDDTERSDARRVLIIRPSALGDVARSVPVLASVRRALPREGGARVDWLVSEACADAVRHHPMLDGVVTFSRRQWWRGGGVWSTMQRLRAGDYDLVLDVQGLARSGLFALATGARRRVGYADARELGWLGCNVRHRVPSELHAVERMLALTRAEGFEAVRDMRLYVGEAEAAWAAAWRAEGRLEAGSYVCLAPTAKWGCKRWPLAKWAELGRRLLARGEDGERLVVLAAPSERAEVEPLIEALGDERVVMPTTTVGRLMAVLAGAGLLVSNDSAPLHLAVGLGRPTVAIFGPTDPALVGPYGREDCVVQPPGVEREDLTRYRRLGHDDRLIGRVSVEAVWDKVEKVKGQ